MLNMMQLYCGSYNGNTGHHAGKAEEHPEVIKNELKYILTSRYE